MCSGLNLPLGSHHSAAIASNFATSAGVDGAGRPCPRCAHCMRAILRIVLDPVHARYIVPAMKENLSATSARSARAARLYPPIEPFRQQVLEMPGRPPASTSSNAATPTALPVIVLHGGPGGGCSPGDAALLRPARTTAPCCSTSAAAAGRARTPASRTTPPGTSSPTSSASASDLGIERWARLRRLLGRLPRAALRAGPPRAGARRWCCAASS